jgi:hypothetical protein
MRMGKDEAVDINQKERRLKVFVSLVQEKETEKKLRTLEKSLMLKKN